MRLIELQDFYKTASLDQIQALVESSAQPGDTRVWSEIIQAANQDQGWQDTTAEELLEELRTWGYDARRD